MKIIRSWCPCILIFLSIVLNAQAQSVPVAGVQLRVLSYNIHHCNPPSAGNMIDVEAIASVIRESKADLVALQEVDVNTFRSGKGQNQASLLAEMTGMNYYFSKAIDHEGGAYGVAILSRFPIMDSMRLDLPIHAHLPEELRTLAAITVTVAAGRKLVFASTHLGLIQENRKLQVENILSAFQSIDSEIVLAGDFNAEPQSEEMKLLYGRFRPSCMVNCAFTIPVVMPNRKIDYILHSAVNSIKVLKSYTINEQYASDHLPILSLVELVDIR